MTSDAKIGLLLGLVFIFIIAFIINGLPKFRDKTNNHELPTNMVNFADGSLGIGLNERKVQEALNLDDLVRRQSFGEVQPAVEDAQVVRSITPLPGDVSRAEQLHETTEVQSEQALVPPPPVPTKATELENPKPAKPAWPKSYVVREGDNLAGIAQKFYGPEEGNRRININGIFEANRTLLRSPDQIYVGQKLVIPSPSSLTVDKNKPDGVLSGTLFEKVESIGRKYLSVDSSGAKQSTWYVVREGDNLWKIAAEQLGNGARYAEIGGLNADILDDEDSLAVGTRLRIPAR